MHEFAPLIGIVASGILVIAGVIYIFEMFTGETRPSRISWLVWALIGVLGFESTLSAGAGWASATAATYAVLYLVTFIISCFPGRGKNDYARYDPLLLCAALLGLAFWWTGTLSALEAAVLVVLVDGVSCIPTVRGTIRNPKPESRTAWTLDSIGNCLALTALGSLAPAAVLYPAYLALITTAVAAITIFGPSRIQPPPGHDSAYSRPAHRSKTFIERTFRGETDT